VGKKMLDLQTDLNNLNISDQHRDTIQKLIDFYFDFKRPSFERLELEIDNLINEAGLFISAESEIVNEDDWVLVKAKKQVEELGYVKNTIKKIK